MPKRPKLKLAVLDTETDPFKKGRVPKPFCAGFYTEGLYIDTWGPDCIPEIVEAIDAEKDRFLIFAHNGGRFDFHFFLPYIDNPIKIINGRIVQARFGSIGSSNRHVFQDSFAMIPAPLRKSGNKMDVDEDFYKLFEPHLREKHRAKIRDYLQQDCIALYEWVERFHEEFGRRLTVGGTGMRELKKFYDFMPLSKNQDAFYRTFYFGGRVECIEPGDHRGAFKVYDVNSMYPHVMRDFRHPINAEFDQVDRLPTSEKKVAFAIIDATSEGALPIRQGEGIVFPYGRTEFRACSHEINMAHDLGLLKIHKVKVCHVAQQTTSFGDFVDHFFARRLEYKAKGDFTGDQLYKYVMNSCYGKFGQDPENFKDWLISWEIGNPEPETHGYDLYSTCEHFDLWNRPADNADRAYNDVSVAASITSASRATLLHGLYKARRPVYCDTDSIICESLDVDVDAKRLGAWKLEEEADRVVIAGKKLYALQHDGKWTKVRSKGGSLSGPDILAISRGEIFEYENPVPVFSARLNPVFVKRQFRKTAKPPVDRTRLI